jgi:hypothetical protein
VKNAEQELNPANLEEEVTTNRKDKASAITGT